MNSGVRDAANEITRNPLQRRVYFAMVPMKNLKTAPQPQTDAFGTSPSGGFADFADFDNKQASSVFGASTTSLNSTSNSATTNTNTTTKPTDFSDDPFKDYRYEDPFSIKDPFDSTMMRRLPRFLISVNLRY
uniref:Uncharacterized protein n=1 Tax=Megaselia scalaris TaxID=36166 RepID=T1GAX3_MEGSC